LQVSDSRPVNAVLVFYACLMHLPRIYIYIYIYAVTYMKDMKLEDAVKRAESGDGSR
jgi:uncharacterized membrane protein